jgi:predicted XRE-type DNA-binding protein
MTGIQESACDIWLPPSVAGQAGLERELLAGRFCFYIEDLHMQCRKAIENVHYACKIFTMAELTKPLIDELRGWCKQKRGRQREVSQALGVSDSTVSDWFHARKKLTGEQTMAVLAFLENLEKHSKSARELVKR